MSKLKPAFILSLLIPLFASFIFPLFSFAQNNTTEEIMTFETYYPAPYGVYNEMRAKRMAVGTNYYNGSAYPWDTGGSCTGNEICNADLVVQGNVGIGTTDPVSILHIKTLGESDVRVTGSTISRLRLETTTGGGREVHVYNDAPSGLYGLWDSVNARTLTVNYTGNVGIGTTDPIGKLEVAGNIYLEPIYSASSRYIGARGWASPYYGTNPNNGFAGLEIERIDAPGEHKLHLLASWDGLAQDPRKVTIRGDGRVGIGTVSPSEKLDVVGNAIISGTIRGATYGFGGSYQVRNGDSSCKFGNPFTGNACSCPAGFTEYVMGSMGGCEGPISCTTFGCYK